MILCFQRILPHYRLPVFEQLSKALNNRLVVVYGSHHGGAGFSEATPSGFATIKAHNLWVHGETLVFQDFFKALTTYPRPEALIIEHNPRYLSVFPLLAYCKSMGIPFILWGHGGSRFREVERSSSPRDLIHRFLIARSDAYICYSEGVYKRLCGCSDRTKLFIARNTLDTKALLALDRQLQKKSKTAIANSLGIPVRDYLVFIGRLLRDKGLDYLLDVYSLVKKRRSNAGLIIIGDGPEAGSIRQKIADRGQGDIVLTGSLPRWEDSAPYLHLASCMVLPGYVGLSVNHAFCFGLPVITQKTSLNGPFHSPEADFIIAGQTGFFSPNGDKEAMATDIIRTFTEHRRFAETTRKYAQDNLGIDRMIAGVVEALAFVGARQTIRTVPR